MRKEKERDMALMFPYTDEERKRKIAEFEEWIKPTQAAFLALPEEEKHLLYLAQYISFVYSGSQRTKEEVARTVLESTYETYLLKDPHFRELLGLSKQT